MDGNVIHCFKCFVWKRCATSSWEIKSKRSGRCGNTCVTIRTDMTGWKRRWRVWKIECEGEERRRLRNARTNIVIGSRRILKSFKCAQRVKRRGIAQSNASKLTGRTGTKSFAVSKRLSCIEMVPLKILIFNKLSTAITAKALLLCAENKHSEALQLQSYARNLFLKVTFNFFVHFLQYFHFYASYNPDFFTDAKNYCLSTIYIECKCGQLFPFSWDCFWKVHGLKFHPIWFSSITN